VEGLYEIDLFAGKDYPGSWHEFQVWFPNDDACRHYLERLRWPDGFVCPACGHNKAWRSSGQLWKCKKCSRRTSVTAGTILDKTRTPLTIWFAAVWYVTNQKLGVSALGLQRVLGFGSQQTAWTMLHKFRKAMVRPGRTKLVGEVEVDETYVGGPIKGGKRGRGADKKFIVVIAVELHEPKGYGRIRMRYVLDVTVTSLVPFVCNVVEAGSLVRTDGFTSYESLSSHGYRHNKLILSTSDSPAHVSMPAVHLVASLLKRWLLGTHHGSVHSAHLQAYLEEYTFRFNRRNSHRRGLLFYRLLQQIVVTTPESYKAIVDK
jgi:transposase-like protein